LSEVAWPPFKVLACPTDNDPKQQQSVANDNKYNNCNNFNLNTFTHHCNCNLQLPQRAALHLPLHFSGKLISAFIVFRAFHISRHLVRVLYVADTQAAGKSMTFIDIGLLVDNRHVIAF